MNRRSGILVYTFTGVPSLFYTIFFLLLAACGDKSPAENTVQLKIPNEEKNLSMDSLETATFGAGCFWCTEAIFQNLKGVVNVESGYSGGIIKNPSYKEVCAGNTGHTEVIQITFNPEVISFDELLNVFFEVHDPTTLNRQGGDVGTQYRSAIYYHSQEQKNRAENAKKEVEKNGGWNNPIVTEIAPFSTFYKAEDYHQDYFSLNGGQPYCQMVIAPKIQKFRKHFENKLKK